MINRVNLKNFKCFETASFPMNKLTVLSGVNGMGKSTLIQSLLVLRQSSMLKTLRELGLLVNGPLTQLGSAQELYHDGSDSEDGLEIEVEFTDEYSALFKFENQEDKLVLVNREEILNRDLSPFNLFNSERFFYLNAERIGPRRAFPFNDYDYNKLNQIGNSGEYTAHLLSLKEMVDIPESKLRHDSVFNPSLRTQVEAWLSDIGQIVRLHLDSPPRMEQVKLEFSFAQGSLFSKNYRASNVGFGLTYALPIIVAPLIAPEGSLVIIENPEAHLHPKGQVIIGQFLSRMASSGIQVIIETHSDHVLNGIRLEVKKGRLSPENVSLNFITKSANELSSSVMSPEIDSDGRLSEWPDGFFDQFEKALFELM